MFETLLPACAKVVVAKDWMWNTPVFQEEEAFIERAVEKRRREFRASRHSAHEALSVFEHNDFRLLPGGGRAPQWPAGIVGAVTHTGQFCAVAIAAAQECRGLGIDAEQNSPLSDELKQMICTPSEQAWVTEQEAAGKLWVSKLIFSAKESVHKVYYPLNQYTLDFLDAELVIDLAACSFHARILKPVVNASVPIHSLKGRFFVDDQLVYSAIFYANEPI
ncbi:phosphopantetheinyl transferase [gamma proteobacterium HdN1]|nr:phosphopantetheinyl transferase [gamma proteobacterium HdN1]